MEQTQAVGEGAVTFEQFMAGMRELRKSQEAFDQQLRKSKEEFDREMKETDRRIQESREEFNREMKESDRRIRESQEETARQMRETNRQLNKRFGELTNRFGDMVEYMVLPNLLIKFEELGFTFIQANRTEIKDKKHGIFMEIDALLENGDKVMAVEIKTKPTINDINDHVERMEKLRIYADLRGDQRKYRGAVAGVVFSEGEKIYTLKKGFYVIEPSVDTFTITEPKGNYHPHEW